MLTKKINMLDFGSLSFTFQHIYEVIYASQLKAHNYALEMSFNFNFAKLHMQDS